MQPSFVLQPYYVVCSQVQPNANAVIATSILLFSGCKQLYDSLFYAGSVVRTPISRLTAKQKQDVLQTVVRSSRGKAASPCQWL